MARPHPLLVDLAAGRNPNQNIGADAERLVASAIEHRMHGLLWSSSEGGQPKLPSRQTMLLSATSLAVQAHHARLWATLSDIQARLAEIGVQAAVAKGVPAELRWYGRAGERPCQDIDLLINPASKDRIGEVLDVLQPRHRMRSELIALVGSGTLQSVDLVVEGVAVDLHLDLLKVEIPTRGTEALWARTQLIPAPNGTPVRVLDPETSLIHFAIHLNKDRFARLLAYADIARLMAREPMDWSFIDGFLRREGLRTPVYCTLRAVTDELQLPPPHVPRPRGWRARAWAKLWPTDRRLRGHISLGTEKHRQLWIPWLAENRTAEALRWWIRRRLLPPAELLALYDPDLAGPYSVRWLVGRYRGWRRRQAAINAVRRFEEKARTRR